MPIGFMCLKRSALPSHWSSMHEMARSGTLSGMYRPAAKLVNYNLSLEIESYIVHAYFRTLLSTLGITITELV